MKNNGPNQNPPPTVAQFHALIREHAIKKGMAIPETDEEFAMLEKTIDCSTLPKHDFGQVLALINTGETRKTKVIEFPKADESFVKDFALAARNGTQIPAEIKKRMEADRAAAEKDRQRK